MSAEALHEIFKAAFPATSSAREPSSEVVMVSLEYVETAIKGVGAYGVVARLISWSAGAEPDTLRIRDVKEQELVLAPATLDLDRVRAFATALVRVLSEVLSRGDPEYFMPHDLIDFRPLDLVKARTEQDFDKALRAKSRLGRYLPS